MSFLQDWYRLLTQPKTAFVQLKDHASLTDGLKNVVAAGLVYGFFFEIVIGMAPNARLFMAIAWAASVFVLESLLGVGILFLFAKLLSGNADFMTHFYLLSQFFVPVMFLYAIVSILASYLFSPLFLLIPVVYLFGLYLTTLALREAHGFGLERAVAAWLILPVLLALIAIILFFAARFAFSGGPGNPH